MSHFGTSGESYAGYYIGDVVFCLSVLMESQVTAPVIVSPSLRGLAATSAQTPKNMERTAMKVNIVCIC